MAIVSPTAYDHEEFMNRKTIILLATVIAALFLTWVGRSFHGARHNLVTLDVRNAPLPEVLAHLERQTRERIVADQRLDTKITLSVRRTPLPDVLDLVSQQAGAAWTQYHAVHSSPQALDQLVTALQQRTPLPSVGWTNIAPAFETPPLPSPQDLADAPHPGGRRVIVQNSGPVIVRRGPGPDTPSAPGEPAQTVDVDVRADGPPGSPAVAGTAHARPTMRIVTMSRAPDGQLVQESWTPEVVSLDTRLQSKWSGDPLPAANAAIAKNVATELKAKATTLYVLRKMPGGFSMPPGLMSGHLGPDALRDTQTRTNAAGDVLAGSPDFESMVKRAQAETYTKLTPEQRVRRAQERQSITNP